MQTGRNILLAAALAAAAACSAGGKGTGDGLTAASGGVNGGGFGGQSGGLGTGAFLGTGSTFATGGAGGEGSGGGGAGTGGAPYGGQTHIDECLPVNPGGFDATTTQALMAGGPAGSLRLLNPYDGTVFPRGLIAPLLMWDGVSSDAVYVHVQSQSFEYKGCFRPSGTNQLQLPQPVWEALSAATGGKDDPFTLSLTTSNAGVAAGPVSQELIVAKATLKGSIYYGTYKSKLVTPTDIIGAVTGGQGAVLRIKPGSVAEPFLGHTTCTGCHSVSANGKRIVANPKPVLSTREGATYAVDVNTAPNPPPLAPNAQTLSPATLDGSFPGVSHDGSLYVSNAHIGGIGPRAGGLANDGAPSAALYETATGNPIANSGVPTGAMMAMFSTDSTLLAFTDYAIGNGHGMAVMDFNLTTRTASNYRQVFQTTTATDFAGWPFFLPDSKALVFAIGNAGDFSGMATGLMGPIVGATSDLYILDIQSGTSKLLAKAMGFDSEQAAVSGTTYLPFGAPELHHNYYPTVSPVAAGGYFWVFFDSYRHYGNTHAIDGGMVRQLWGVAIDISPSGAYTTDPSHPPFYLTGQEDVLGNHRAFAALDPCRADGSGCTTGIDCCGGFCTNGKCEIPVQADAAPVCARTDESCATAPCCSAADRCIGGFCGEIPQ